MPNQFSMADGAGELILKHKCTTHQLRPIFNSSIRFIRVLFIRHRFHAPKHSFARTLTLARVCSILIELICRHFIECTRSRVARQMKYSLIVKRRQYVIFLLALDGK